MDYCHIVKDRRTGEKFLIPSCWSVINSSWNLPPKELIKEYCTCDRPKRTGIEKYVELEKDEVIERILKLEAVIQKAKEELEICKEEVMLLNLEIDIDLDELVFCIEGSGNKNSNDK